MERYPSVATGTTVALSEYACAVAGVLQVLCGMGTVRVDPAPMNGPPNIPVAPRVSSTRHGVTGTNTRPAVWPEPDSFTVNVCPATVIVPVRAAPVACTL